MASSSELVDSLRSAWGAEDMSHGDDYALVIRVGGCYGAVTRDGFAALVVPLVTIRDRAIGKRAAGCELRAITAARFRFEDKEWEGAAAALVCTERPAPSAFSVLAVDVAAALPTSASWADVATHVSEWQALLAATVNASATSELGLWGELWAIERSSRPGHLVAGWRGPDRDSTDFFLEGVGVEVKASRVARQHYVSMSQVGDPVGARASYLMSLWVKEDPIRGASVPELVARIESRVDDRAALLRGLLKAGYTRASAYEARYVLLADPEWYPTHAIPTVRVVDPGVFELRFGVTLDGERALDARDARALAAQVLGHSHEREPS